MYNISSTYIVLYFYCNILFCIYVQYIVYIVLYFYGNILKVHRKNVLKDFVAMAGPLGVSHMLMFTKSEVSVNLRICRLPRGPTLTFQVNSYTTISDLAHHVST